MMVEGRHGGKSWMLGAEAESSHFKSQTGSTEGTGMVRIFDTSKPTPVMYFLQQGHASQAGSHAGDQEFIAGDYGGHLTQTAISDKTVLGVTPE